jgi:hypothetical protein
VLFSVAAQPFFSAPYVSNVCKRIVLSAIELTNPGRSLNHVREKKKEGKNKTKEKQSFDLEGIQSCLENAG